MMMFFAKLRAFLLGEPLDTRQTSRERLSNPQGLAIFASDSLSSTAYATEEILLVLVAAGAVAFTYSIPIASAIGILVFVVAISYRQLIHAYPQGGGAYTVSRDNLGELTALTAGATLFVDYVLTVAVSIAAGTAAITSAFPQLYPWKIAIALGTLVFIAWGNLRGVRESGKLFAIPTYMFIFSALSVIGYGLWRYLSGTFPEAVSGAATLPQTASAITLFLILRAFAAGCTALTGIEATSNGVRAFRPPEAKNAANTMTVMAVLLAIIFVGLTVLANALAVIPKAEETVVSQIAAGLLDKNYFYFLVQFSTAAILLLAANTAFAGFPRLGSILAKDKYFPHQFYQLSSRLVYSSGIIILAIAAGGLLILFRANTHLLIPLYAVGVFLVFTISQFGMVRHWIRRHKHGKHRINMYINAFGGTLTAVVLAVVFITKFRYGAWMLVPAIFALIILMQTIRRHYGSVAAQLSLANPPPSIPEEKTVIIPVSGVHQGTLKAVEFIKLLNPEHILAVHVSTDPEEAETVRKKWVRYIPGIPLEIIESPHRELIEPLINYIESVQKQWEKDIVIVALPEFVPTKFWHHFLHNQTAKHIRDTLEHREDVIIVDVPYRLQDRETLALRGILWQTIFTMFEDVGRLTVWLITFPFRLKKAKNKR